MADTVVVGGKGFSVAPSKQAAFIRKEKEIQKLRRRRGGGRGGSVGGGGPTLSTVEIFGDTVVIDGLNFSVAPSKQAAFIQQRTGGSGLSVQAAIAAAESRSNEILQQQLEQKRATEQQAVEQRKRFLQTIQPKSQFMDELRKGQQRQAQDQRMSIGVEQKEVLVNGKKDTITVFKDPISGSLQQLIDVQGGIKHQPRPFKERRGSAVIDSLKDISKDAKTKLSKGKIGKKFGQISKDIVATKDALNKAWKEKIVDRPERFGLPRVDEAFEIGGKGAAGLPILGPLVFPSGKIIGKGGAVIARETLLAPDPIKRVGGTLATGFAFGGGITLLGKTPIVGKALTTGVGKGLGVAFGAGLTAEALTSEEKLSDILGREAVILGLFGAGAVGGSRSVKAFTDKIRKEIPKRARVKGSLFEIEQQNIKFGDTIKPFTRIAEITELAPPKTVIETTKIGEILKRPGKVVEELPAQRVITKTLESDPLIGKDPFLVESIQTGKRQRLIQEIAGETKQTSIREIQRNAQRNLGKEITIELNREPFVLDKKLTKGITTSRRLGIDKVMERLGLGKSKIEILGKTKFDLKTASEISKGLSKIDERLLSEAVGQRLRRGLETTKSDQIFRTDLIQESRFKTDKSLTEAKDSFIKITLGKGKIKGKSKRLSRNIAVVSELAETDFIRELDATIAMKDVTNPLARAAGKTKIMTGVIRQSKVLLDLTQPRSKILKKGNITKTPLGKTFMDQQLQEIVLALPVPTKVTTIPKPKAIIQPRQPRQVTIADSLFAGKGLYERSDLVSPKVPSLISAKSLTSVRTTLAPKQIIKNKARLLNKTLTKTRSRLLLDVNTFSKTLTEQKINQVERVKQRQLQRQKQLQRQRQRLSLKLQQKVMPVFGLGFRPTKLRKFKPIEKIPKIKLPEFKLAKLPKKKIKASSFKIFVRKMGEDFEIGERETRPEAIKALKKRLDRTLRASGFIKEGQRKLRFEELNAIENQFRVSKKDPFRLVEKRGRRLSTRPEVKEIQFFKKSKALL